jgi:hypothetical protein
VNRGRVWREDLGGRGKRGGARGEARGEGAVE